MRLSILIQWVFGWLSLVFMSALTGCEDPPPAPTQAEIVTGMLVSGGTPWSPSVVTVDGVEVTDDLFAGFSITFAENTFTTTGDSPVWLEQDTWSFKDETAAVIVRGQDEKEVVIESISETQLKLTLEWDQTTREAEGGRRQSLKGKHEFTLNK